MKSFFDKFLFGVLWLLSITLVATLWMNTNYGFDILSAAHWEYLGSLQAHRSGIKPDFYISLLGALFIALIGLYLIVRPRTHRAKKIAPMAQTPNIAVSTQSPGQPTQEPKIENDLNQRPIPPASLSSRPVSPLGLRPPTIRPLNTSPQNITIPKPNQPIPTTQPANSPEVQRALESADYVIKKCARIGKLENPAVAIAYDQNMWIVSTKVSPETMVDAIQTLISIFDDTLGETANDISVHGFIIEPTEQVQRDDNLIITFDNTTDFVKYVSEHKNEKPDDYDAELFEAFSTYISTVTGYIGKT